MSIMGDALDKWLDKYNAVSVMHQRAYTLCEQIPSSMRKTMIDVTRQSYDKGKEMGFAIRNGFEIGPIRTGSDNRVAIVRSPDTIGTFHTHTAYSESAWAGVAPGHRDIFEAMAKNDKILCIGNEGIIGVKIACYSPIEPLWSEYKEQMLGLLRNLKDYYKRIRDHYGIATKKLRGPGFGALLRAIADPNYIKSIGELRPQDVLAYQEDAANKLKAAQMANRQIDIVKEELVQVTKDFDVSMNIYNAEVELNIPKPGSFLTIGTRVLILTGSHTGDIGSITQMVLESEFEELKPSPHEEVIRTRWKGGKRVIITHGVPGEIVSGKVIPTGRVLYRVSVDHEIITLQPNEIALSTADVNAAKSEFDRAKINLSNAEAKVRAAQSIAGNADAEAEIARIKAQITPEDIERGRREAELANSLLREGGELETRRQELLRQVQDQIRMVGYPVEERENMAIDQCKVVWEELYEERPPEEWFIQWGMKE